MRGSHLALAAMLAAGSGCSALVAAVLPDDDLSVLLPGVPRVEVERELGRPEHTHPTLRGLEAIYVVRCGQAGTWGDNVNTVAKAGLDAVRDVHHFRPAHPATYPGALRALLAVPTMIGTDFLLAVRQLARLPNRRRRVRVLYDGDERLVAHDLSPAHR